jgi:maltokinase
VTVERSLDAILRSWRERHVPDADADARTTIDVVDVEVIRPGRPGLVDVVAEMDGRLGHAVLAVLRPEDPLDPVGTAEEPILGSVEDGDGVGIVVDALHDADAARLLLEAVEGRSPGAGSRDRRAVSVVRDDGEVTVLAVDRRVTLSVLPWLARGPHPGITLIAGLDEAGFNHLAAPVAFWRRAGRDLGVVQELLAGASSGWELAISSLRDMIASGEPPAAAGGDFAAEAFALGTMTARMHVALDRAFGRRSGDVASLADAIAAGPRRAGSNGRLDPLIDERLDPLLDGRLDELLDELRRCGVRTTTIRTHGDFHLGRTARTDYGWILADSMPGGTDPGSEEPVYRCPLADVADFTSSLRRAADVAVAERGPVPAGAPPGDLAAAWEARNRRAFVAAYLATPGIGGLVPADRRIVRRLLAFFELAHEARCSERLDVP